MALEMLRGICWVQTSPKAAYRLVLVCKCFSVRAFFTCGVLLWAELLVLFVLWTSQRPPLFVCVSKQFQTTFQQQFSASKWHCYRAESSCRAKRFGQFFFFFCVRDNLSSTNRPTLLLHMWNESTRIRKCLGNLHSSKHWSKVQTHFRK